MSDTALLISDLRSYSGEIFACRICHEEGFQRLEAPCACSGTVKFAHRDCIQRWCNEKGNTTCEICLEKFESGYTSPPQKTQLNDTTVTIRFSLDLEDSRTVADQQNDEEILENAADKSATYCRSVALVFTALLLIRHIYVVLAVGGHPFSLLTMLIAKISGILFPMYILLRIFTALLDTVRHHSQNPEMGM